LAKGGGVLRISTRIGTTRSGASKSNTKTGLLPGNIAEGLDRGGGDRTEAPQIEGGALV